MIIIIIIFELEVYFALRKGLWLLSFINKQVLSQIKAKILNSDFEGSKSINRIYSLCDW